MNDYALIKPKKMLLAIDTHYFLGYKVSSSWIVIFILELKKKRYYSWQDFRGKGWYESSHIRNKTKTSITLKKKTPQEEPTDIFH